MNQLTPKKFIAAQGLLHLGFTFMPAMLVAVSYLQNQDSSFNLSDTSNPFFYVVPILAILGPLLGSYLYAKKKKELTKIDSLKTKLGALQAAMIINYATIEGPALLGLVAFMQSGNLFFLAIAVVLLAYLFLQRPTKAKIERDLQLDFELKNQFNQQDTPLT